jgi:hypothetical protein
METLSDDTWCGSYYKNKRGMIYHTGCFLLNKERETEELYYSEKE